MADNLRDFVSDQKRSEPGGLRVLSAFLNFRIGSAS
jgi:hypothetical protein